MIWIINSIQFLRLILIVHISTNLPLDIIAGVAFKHLLERNASKEIGIFNKFFKLLKFSSSVAISSEVPLTDGLPASRGIRITVCHANSES